MCLRSRERSSMRRTGLFLLMMFLVVPVLRECCLPAIATHHCHESSDSGNPSCLPNAVVGTENRTTVAFFAQDFGLAEGMTGDSTQFGSMGSATVELTSPHTHPVDLYLRTRALLI